MSNVENKDLPCKSNEITCTDTLNLVHMCRALPFHGIGGMEKHAWDLARDCSSRGHKIKFITTSMDSKCKRDAVYHRDGVECTFLGNTPPMRYSSQFFKASTKLFEKMCISNSDRPNIVHSQSSGALGLVKNGILKREKIPLVVTQHGTHLMEVHSRLAGASISDPKSWAWAQKSRIVMNWNRHFKGKPFLQSADRVICVSEQVREQAIDEYNLDPQSVITIPNGLDTEEFRPGKRDENIMMELGLRSDLPIVLFLGRMEKEKGPELVLRTWKESSLDEKTQLLMVGGGSALNSLCALHGQMNLKNVVITGMVPQNRVSQCFRLADIFCFPTLRKEGLPYNILEAMSSALPVITTPMGGIPSAVDEKVGRFIKPDPANLADMILGLLENDELRRDLGRAGRNRILKRYSLDGMVDATLKVYRDVLEEM